MFDKAWNSLWAAFTEPVITKADTEAVSLANASLPPRNVVTLAIVEPRPQPSIKWLRRNLRGFAEYQDAIKAADLRAADSKDRYQCPRY